MVCPYLDVVVAANGRWSVVVGAGKKFEMLGIEFPTPTGVVGGKRKAGVTAR